MAAGGVVQIRAFRGSRRTAVYRDHVLDRDAFSRIVEAGAGQRLPLLSSLAPGRLHELQKDDARRLAAEVSLLQAEPRLLDLDRDLTLIAELARWCARTRGDAWLRIDG